MRIIELEQNPFHYLPFINAARGGGIIPDVLPLIAGRAEGLPSHIQALVITSDLQGVASLDGHESPLVLLGIRLAHELRKLAELGQLPSPEKTGVILAGDLYSAPAGDVRGASGDVREVWTTFAEHFRWVTGVSGNHDRFGTAEEQAALEAIPHLSLLDGSVVDHDGLCIGGVGCVIGDPNRAGRRSEEDFLETLANVLNQSPDLLVLHQGPEGAPSQRGNREIGEIIDLEPPPLVVCGHLHWSEPLADRKNTQILNVDKWAIILRPTE